MDYYVDNYTLEELLPAPPSYTEHNNGCITMSQSKWITYWVDSCYYEAVWPELNLTGEASYTVLDNQFYVHIPNEESSGWLMANVVPGQSNALVFEVDALSSGMAIISAEEYVNGNWVSLGGINIDEVRSYDFSIKPTQTQVKISIFGPVDVYYKKICVRIPVMKQEHVLVDVCPDSKDRYRFGFNGQEKVNEWAGIGNHNTAQFWEYDTRTGRRLNLDPVDQISISNYGGLKGNPIWYVDPDGAVVKFMGYKNKEKAPITDEQAEQVWNDMVAYLYKHGLADQYKALVESETIYDVYFFAEMNGSKYFSPNQDAITGKVKPEMHAELHLNPWQALKTHRNYMISPIEGAIHEIGHAYLYNENPAQYHLNGNTPSTDGMGIFGYGNLHEEKVITGIEQIAARKIGNVEGLTRTQHGGTPIAVLSATPN